MEGILRLVLCGIVMMTALFSCSGSASKTVRETSMLQTGDLIFLSIPEGGDTLYIHTSIVDIDDDGTFVIDATAKRGVARYPLDTMIADYHRHDGTYPTFEVFRLKDTSGVGGFVENALSFVGESYDAEFVMGNGNHYCTELVYDSYVRAGTPLFETCPIDFRNAEGEFPAFWTRVFGNLGAEVPQGNIGTLPAQMRRSELLFPVTVIRI